ncbi:hypothetical protein [Paraburkholderia humisilvae]|uniref:hypothetical protein n=1 Tax=Paraburkholderia humisilvae TaxID=627669 RepID=UPI0036160216
MIGLGADGLPSACHGPEEVFLAFKQHTPLALFLASATPATVFITSFGYSPIIELFSAAGRGYRVATELSGPHYIARSGYPALAAKYRIVSVAPCSSRVRCEDRLTDGPAT